MTNDLRRLIDVKLNSIKTACGIKDIGYRRASDAKLFPHVVWEIVTTVPTDMGRQDYLIDFHVWGKDEETCFVIADRIRDLMSFLNAPDTLEDQQILPTIYEQSGGTIADPDQSIVHVVLRFQAQVYMRTATNSSILQNMKKE